MVNSPLPTDLGAECRKCSKIIDQFVKPEKGKGPDQLIPPHIIANAKGLAVLSVIKAGFIFSGRAGSGLVIARLGDGSWSAPSAIATGGMGVGGQIGAELTDFIIILNTADAVKAFSHGGNVTLGGNLSVAAGPFGRNAEAAGTVGNFAAIYSYSKTRGLFAGVSIEGSVIVERKDANATFYHRKVGAKEILSGTIPPPPAAEDLYRALNRRSNFTSSTATISDPTPAPPGSLSRFNTTASAQSAYAEPSAPAPYQPPAYGASTYAPPSQSNLHTASQAGFLSDQKPQPYRAAPPPPQAANRDTAVALYDFSGERAGDLDFRKGDIVIVTVRTDSTNDWWTGRCNGREGVFPANYVQMQ
ncbi:hypothetical protein BDK51DRAFT_23398 [Blyttiomyces helicus]|uniref:SH3 domain-containing protein n=1 Tax=Blyttiomyces helicus TaxID=388810 RepID=A0A4V1IR96_9FUNG|nr:hypothetical protein BDK51DRAFT_23398 [Blyttiomyces helicus]|eukprot:RKO89287.1 hypothetical protein BDK51DRAFT_23398 [Blyttiomyces helicus]